MACDRGHAIARELISRIETLTSSSSLTTRILLLLGLRLEIPSMVQGYWALFCGPPGSVVPGQQNWLVVIKIAWVRAISREIIARDQSHKELCKAAQRGVCRRCMHINRRRMPRARGHYFRDWCQPELWDQCLSKPLMGRAMYKRIQEPGPMV